MPVSADRLVRIDNGHCYTFTSSDALERFDAERKVGSAVRLPASVKPPLFHLADGSFEEAVAAWEELLRSEPASPLASEELHVHYAFELMSESRVDDALVVLRAAVAVVPDSAEAAAVLAFALAAKGDDAAAIATFERALEKLDADPKIPAAHKAGWRIEVEGELAKVRARLK